MRMSLRETLKHQLFLRSNADPHFSKKQFASELDIAPSVLSQLLSGKRNIGRSTAQKLVEKLKLPKSAALDEMRAFTSDSGCPAWLEAHTELKNHMGRWKGVSVPLIQSNSRFDSQVSCEFHFRFDGTTLRVDVKDNEGDQQRSGEFCIFPVSETVLGVTSSQFPHSGISSVRVDPWSYCYTRMSESGYPTAKDIFFFESDQIIRTCLRYGESGELQNSYSICLQRVVEAESQLPENDTLNL